jgi:adenylate kinase family enzyme
MAAAVMGIGERVLVMGCSGAGKTVLVHRLARATGLPAVSLDRHYWQPGWVEPEREWWRARVEALAAEPRWIMEGNYLRTLPPRLARAHTVIVLDLPRLLCLRRVLLRMIRSYGRTRPEMAEGCPERFDPKFLNYIWTYPRLQRGRVIEALRGFPGTLTICRSAADVAAVVAGVEQARSG